MDTVRLQTIFANGGYLSKRSAIYIDPTIDPDENDLTEEEDFDQEEENDRREIQVGDDDEEPDPEDDYLLEEPLFDPEDDDED